MKKFGFIAAGLVALPLSVSADVTIYGRANVSLDFLDDGADYSELAVSSNASMLGFRTQREFDRFTAVMQIEQEIDVSNQGSNWASRDTFVGLRGDFGMLRLGKFDTPFKRARGPAVLFGEQLGDLRNFTRYGNGRFDERMPNSIHYQTPSRNGLQGNIAFSAHEDTDANSGSDNALSLSVTWSGEDINLAVAYEKFEDDRSRGGRQAFRLAANYDIGDWRLVGFFQTIDHDDDAFDADVYGVGVLYRLSERVHLKGQYFERRAEAADSDSQMVTVGAEYIVSSPLRFYLNYARVANDTNADLTPWDQGRTTRQPGSPGNTASGLNLGLRFTF